MSRNQYLDELDSLLDNPQGDAIAPLSLAIESNKLDSMTEETSLFEATSSPHSDNSTINQDTQLSNNLQRTWASVMESTAEAMQESSKLSQEAIQKNIALAKTQQESIKELADAAGGWRHATRQAVQEVNAAKKNVITLTIISGLIAITGFGTTIGVMLQNKSSYIQMSNLILENVDEHQTLVSKTLTLKMDELSSSVEQMQATLAILAENSLLVPEKKLAKQALEIDPDSTSESANEAATITTSANDSLPAIIETTTNADTAVVEQLEATSINNSAIEDNQPKLSTRDESQTEEFKTENLDLLTTNQMNASQWQQLFEQIEILKTDIQRLETQLTTRANQQDAQLLQWVEQVKQQLIEQQQLTSQLDSKLTAKKETRQAQATPSAIEQQQKTFNQNLQQLHKDMNDLRKIQQQMRQQISQMEIENKRNKTAYEEGYRYRSQD